MLEIGALQTNNACSRSGLFEMERIDLHPQHPDITEQDFMQRPLPSGQDLDNDRFDIMSLSLVLNFVGDPAQRGEMLRRVAGFLRTPSSGKVNILPALFLVLPAPCVKNSRYMNEERLEAIMKALGYIRVMRKISSKLVYYLWKYEESAEEKLKEFKKQALRTGKSRNNFAIVLR